MSKIKQLIYNLKYKLRIRIIKLLRNKVLLPHQFKPTMMIKTANSDSLFEVEEIMYDRDLEPVHIVKKFGSNSGKFYTISYPAILDFQEYTGFCSRVWNYGDLMIAGAKIGNVILVELTNHMTREIELVEIKTMGIEGKLLSMKKKPLRFFPWHNIISIELKSN